MRSIVSHGRHPDWERLSRQYRFERNRSLRNQVVEVTGILNKDLGAHERRMPIERVHSLLQVKFTKRSRVVYGRIGQ
jgi:hypothetical protein